jgi:hypothetical protein
MQVNQTGAGIKSMMIGIYGTVFNMGPNPDAAVPVISAQLFRITKNKEYGITMQVRGQATDYFRAFNLELNYPEATQELIVTIDDTGKQKNMTISEFKTLLGLS